MVSEATNLFSHSMGCARYALVKKETFKSNSNGTKMKANNNLKGKRILITENNVCNYYPAYLFWYLYHLFSI